MSAPELRMYPPGRSPSMRECVTSELVELKPAISGLLLSFIPGSIKSVETNAHQAALLWGRIIRDAFIVSCEARIGEEDRARSTARLRLDSVKVVEAVQEFQPYNFTHSLQTELPGQIPIICNDVITNFCRINQLDRPPILFGPTADGGINVSILATTGIPTIVSFLNSASAAYQHGGALDSSRREFIRGGGAGAGRF